MPYEPTRQYAAAALEARVAAADQHGLVGMLIDGALERIGLAQTHLAYANTAAKGSQIGAAMAIVGGLRSSLDIERGGAIAQNLDALYEYMEQRLLQANLHNDPEALGEVASLLAIIKSGWDAIPADRRGNQP